MSEEYVALIVTGDGSEDTEALLEFLDVIGQSMLTQFGNQLKTMPGVIDVEFGYLQKD